ncbi:MAG TPA: FAD-dependent oxidoreductase [Thermoleophilaceae bacterium]|nr:FAD-dependent oxidoreductase [Thermoleophilaceae bacterium]
MSFRVVVCGGGIAAAEALLRLRRLAGDAIELCVIAPNDELVYRPLAVREPFTYTRARRYPLRQIARYSGAEVMRDTLARVESRERVVRTGSGTEVGYDALLVAVGAREVEAYGRSVTFRDSDAAATFGEVIKAIEVGRAASVAFVQPAGPGWPLPLYELALMTATHAADLGIAGLELTLVTPEPQPLAIFGAAVSEVVADRLAGGGVQVHTGSLARRPDERRLVVEPRGWEIRPDRVLAVPRVAGPAVSGLPGDTHGFVPNDIHCCVPGTDGRVFVAGDAADYPVKHGGLGAQMADSGASAIARLAGADVEPQPFHPVIRAKLLTGAEAIYISAQLGCADGVHSEVFEEPPWPAGDKVVAEELGPYLASLGASREKLAEDP